MNREVSEYQPKVGDKVFTCGHPSYSTDKNILYAKNHHFVLDHPDLGRLTSRWLFCCNACRRKSATTGSEPVGTGSATWISEDKIMASVEKSVFLDKADT